MEMQLKQIQLEEENKIIKSENEYILKKLNEMEKKVVLSRIALLLDTKSIIIKKHCLIIFRKIYRKIMNRWKAFLALCLKIEGIILRNVSKN